MPSGIGIGLAAASIGSAVIGGISANKAAKTQAKAAEEAGDTQLQMFERSVELSEPWRESGENALAALGFELGLNERPTSSESSTSFDVGGSSFDTRSEADAFAKSQTQTQTASPGSRDVWGYVEGGKSGGGFAPVPTWSGYTPENPIFTKIGTTSDGVFSSQGGTAPTVTENTSGGGGFDYQGFQKTPGYDFQLDEGQRAINRSLAARGKVLSGPAVKEGLRFSQGLADQTYSNHLTRLANLAGLGGGVAQQQGQFGITTGQGIADSQIQAGNARASGYAATGQAISGGFNFLGDIASGGAFGSKIAGVFKGAKHGNDRHKHSVPRVSVNEHFAGWTAGQA